MTNPSTHPQDIWASGDAYEPYVGRWSRLVAHEFLIWLGIAPGSRWLDVGCGTGALSSAILQETAPGRVKGIDQSASYITYIQRQIRHPRARFEVADAQALPDEAASYEAVVSGLMLNFIPQPDRAVMRNAAGNQAGGGRCGLRLGLRRQDADAAPFLECRHGARSPGRRVG